jgi:hypothetical protein
MTHAWPITCPHCGRFNDLASGVAEKGGPSNPVPRDGDAALCIDCGGWMIFTVMIGAREPTPEEARSLADDHIATSVMSIWRKSKGGRVS